MMPEQEYPERFNELVRRTFRTPIASVSPAKLAASSTR
jgi:hypothetical protein